MSTPVIDFHFHVTTADEYTDWFLNWLRDYAGEDTLAHLRHVLSSPQAMLEYLDEQGIDYAVALAETNPLSTGTSPNDRVAEFCQDSERLIPFANVNPFVTTDLVSELQRCVSDLGVRGLKLYPTYQHFYASDTRLYPLYAEAERLGVPIMVHTGSSVFRGARLKYGDPLHLDDVVVDFPELTIIMAHSGRGFWYEAAFFLAQLHPNIYMEVTGLPPQKLPNYFPNLERNADKIIFGSDWPAVTDIKGNIATVRSLDITEESKDAILGGNAVRVLGLPQ
ncbi:MAG: amidohydrolase family protein [Anaerolineae bacterium]|nr:amidohydrolase family protein [Anaerolineae bacterium]NIN93796.1 amidohydrolase family protein [Anaerolineae bacterium]NIQ76831.1 amidohydrolase family protein [Anaerolineae bacterium]